MILKKLYGALLAVFILSAIGCSTHYTLKENWIDDDDVQYALQHPQVKDWISSFGTPVITEYRGDTVVFMYNYRPHLYKTIKDNQEFKPKNDDRVATWSDRNALIEMQIKNNSLIGIVKNNSYQENVAEKEASTSYLGIIIALLLGAGVALLLAIN